MSSWNDPELEFQMRYWALHPGEFFKDIKPRIWTNPSEDQYEFLEAQGAVLIAGDDGTYRWEIPLHRSLVTAAKGAGKTAALAGLALWACVPFAYVLTYSESILLDGSIKPPGEPYPVRVNVIAGSWNQAENLYNYCKDWSLAHPFIANMLDGEPSIKGTKWKHGGHIKPLSASEKSAYGPHCDILIIDEAVEAGSATTLKERFLLNIFPMNSESMYSKLILSSTPHRYDSMFVQLYENPDLQNIERVFGPWSKFDCPWLPENERLNLLKLKPEATYKVMALGIPFSEVSAIFKGEDIKRCIYKTAEYEQMKNKEGMWVDNPSRPINPYEYREDPQAMCIGGIDFAGPGHETVWLVWQRFPGDEKGAKYLFVEGMAETNPKRQFLIDDVKRMTTKYKVQWWNADCSDHGGEAKTDMLREAGLYMRKVKFQTEKGIMLGITQAIIEQHRAAMWIEAQNLIQQLRRYDPRRRYGDDWVDATMLALREDKLPVAVDEDPKMGIRKSYSDRKSITKVAKPGRMCFKCLNFVNGKCRLNKTPIVDRENYENCNEYDENPEKIRSKSWGSRIRWKGPRKVI